MLKDLIKVSNRLDTLGLTKEADFLDSIIRKLSSRREMPMGAGIEEIPYSDEPVFKIFDEDGDEYEHQETYDLGHMLSEPRHSGLGVDHNQKSTSYLVAMEKLRNMSEKEFNRIKAMHPEAFDALFGPGSLGEDVRKR